jgi:hypothetical protein
MKHIIARWKTSCIPLRSRESLQNQSSKDSGANDAGIGNVSTPRAVNSPPVLPQPVQQIYQLVTRSAIRTVQNDHRCKNLQ